MNTLFEQPAFQLYTAASLTLAALLYGLAFMTGSIRDHRKTVLNPEDVKMYRGAKVVEFEHPDVQRIKRAHLNGIENAVPFFVIGLLYALTNPTPIVAGLLFGVFVGVRVLHAVFYLTRRQPMRGFTFLASALINLVMVVQVVRAVFSQMA